MWGIGFTTSFNGTGEKIVISRRKPVVASVKAAAPDLKDQVANGVKIMRKVWRKGKTDRTDAYWWVEAYTREGAINFMARALKEPANTFDAN